MKNPTVLAAVGLFLIAAVILAFALRAQRSRVPAVASKNHEAAVARRAYYVAPKDPGKPISVDVAAQAYSEALLRTTYNSYRTAVATGNNRLRNALHSSISKDLTKAIGWAEEDLSRSKKPADVEIARKTLESLRR